ncbi:MAG: hypothetical protein WC617_12145 [Rhodanobacter sp.]|jgi:GNAT superfamily N-acetyltransferase
MSIAPFECTFSNEKTLAPEIQLLEIRALDAHDEREPCAWVFVRREEKYTYRQGTKDVEEASITVSYQSVALHAGFRTRTGGTFVASYSRWGNRISLTGLSPHGRGGIMVAGGLRGMRLGTYLFNAIVGWAKQWPLAVVNSIKLSEVDADPDNRLRRNRFYEQFGLVFDYTDAQCRGGKSRTMPASDLQQVRTWEQNITVHAVHEHLGRVLQQNRQLRSDLAARERAIRDLSATANYQASHPIRTALSALWALHARWLVPLLVILGFAAEYHWFGRR